MLLQFAVENFLSFRDLEVFSMEASSDKTGAEYKILEKASLRVLNSAAVYGPNASGKSNLVTAMMWFRDEVLAPVSQNVQQTKIELTPFAMQVGAAEKASFFEVTFLWQNMRYRYGVEFLPDHIVTEYLFRKKSGVKEVPLFKREGQEIKPSATQFKEGKGLEKRTKKTSLYLTVCAAFDVEEANQVTEWFRQFRFVSGLSEQNFFNFTAELLQEKKYQKRLLQFARKADFMINGLSSRLDQISEDIFPDHLPKEVRQQLTSQNKLMEIKINTKHPVFNDAGEEVSECEWNMRDSESEGTQKFIALAGPLIHTLESGSILVIDEFEARLHPKLTSALVKWFQSEANHKGAQLILTTHDVGLMTPDHFRRDQIWLVEKDRRGHSGLKRLSQFDVNQVKPGTRFNRNYLLGLYGASPHVALDEFQLSLEEN